MFKYKNLAVVCSVAVAFFGVYLFVHAGSIDSPAIPSNDSGRMYTLEQIYNAVTSGTTATKQSGGFNEPGSAPDSTMHTLDNIFAKIATGTTNAVSADVLATKTFISRTAGSGETAETGTMANCSVEGSNACYASSGYWTATNGSNVTVTSNTPTSIPNGYYSSKTCSVALTGGTGSVAATGQILSTYHAWDSTGNVLQGSITTQTLNPANETVNAGYYAATTLSAVDSDLAVGNIKSGVNIFGKAGTFKALLPTTFQAVCYNDNAGETIACGGTAWPNQDADTIGDSGACTPTYTQGTYTITDSCTNLEWQRYGHGSNNGYTVPAAAGDCTNGSYGAGYCVYTWQNALKYCANLNNAQMGSGWRLPNAKELQSIARYNISLAIDENFTNTKSGNYWSSTTYANYTGRAWAVNFYDGGVAYNDKGSGIYVRCVRSN